MPRRPQVKPITGIDDPRYVKALSHPLRIRILAMLEESQASPVQLAQHLEATLGTIAYHVRALENFGLIELVSTHQRRGATEHVYAARPHPRISDEAWGKASGVTKQVFIDSLLAQFHQYAKQSAARGGFDRADAHGTRTSLKLDEKGWAQLSAAATRWLGEVHQIEEEATGRLARTGEMPFDVGLIMLLFEAVPFSRVGTGESGATGASHTPSTAQISN